MPAPCTGFVDLRAPFAVRLLPFGVDRWTGHRRVPADQALAGLRLVVQAIVLDGARLGVGSPVLLRLGR